MRRLVSSQRHLTIFDVGANVGQTIRRMRETFPQPTIHAFEPGSDAFNALREEYSYKRGVHINNIALGHRRETKEFIEAANSENCSFLEPGEKSWSSFKQRRPVNITTIDAYCRQCSVERIDILKSDTEGFELEVLKGTSELFAQNRIHLVYLETIFRRLYENSARLDEIYGFLSSRGFDLVSFYRINYADNLAAFTDALFVNRNYEAGSGGA
jgi:FkbM family methyltransferase